ncbi:aminopeptidase N [Nereida sp. MMG025]|uniref:aminopeptidase N n=1 Tax=Nereida sp. MMG025 TaxID=2909981 RepID=UPI001F012B72|nr:aminopeptidase N [Nereida sp. MMG025]MCF6445253.1 aminopeptidase N [Nereida sp. MMG025]
MKDASAATAPETIYLADYQPPAYLLETVHLTFKLSPSATRVISKIAFRPNPEATDKRFFLHGEGPDLKWAKLDGAPVTPVVTDKGLTLEVPDAPFVFEAEVEIDPAANTALEGLYLSNGMFCTQCEAEGFRRITYYPDRPDVMGVFTVRVESDLPVLLSNGNPVAQGDGWAEWHDPWPKPAYLFALVAGDLVAHSDSFTTMDGRDVALNIYVRAADIDKCAFGMEALKASMTWDEQVYGRAYDLDIFNIVAVDDFNMGAMENKGLNIFNSSAVLASPETATDANFERIEAIIAHEYFHNWTGNRITCRDWFQLCLKEGLTVFRDQQFTADMRSAAVARINDVQALRARQFREDAGPLAHPVRPESFVEINNFYTATVYEKGAEVIRMLKLMVGDDAYAKSLDLYFARHDGQACTIEDWLTVFEDSTGRDLAQFKLWYQSAGTPHVTVHDSYEDGSYTLHFDQQTPATPGEVDKAPRVIPIAVALLDRHGKTIAPEQIFELTKTQDSLRFEGVAAKPIPSVLRGFSAPVVLDRSALDDTRLVQMAHDSDPFNAWEAARELALETLSAMALDGTPPATAYLDAWRQMIRNEDTDPAFRALCAGVPSVMELAGHIKTQGQTPDPSAIDDACETFAQMLAEHCQDSLPRLYADHQVSAAYQPDATQAGHRALANRVLGLITRLDSGAQAQAQFDGATNMTQQLAALGALVRAGKGDAALDAFYTQWQHERLVIDKWFGLQASLSPADTAAQVTSDLTQHADFTAKNPNRFRATLGSFAANTAAFHHASGSGYDLLADWLITLDGINPQTTARMTSAFETWPMWDADRQAKMQAALRRILAKDGLSRDVTEMVTRILPDP